MRLLAVDTATDACSCALWLDGECLERFEVAPRRHAELILTQIDDIEMGVAPAGQVWSPEHGHWH